MSEDGYSKQRRWQLNRKKEGKCIICGDKRETGRAELCQECAEKRNSRRKEHRAAGEMV